MTDQADREARELVEKWQQRYETEDTLIDWIAAALRARDARIGELEEQLDIVVGDTIAQQKARIAELEVQIANLQAKLREARMIAKANDIDKFKLLAALQEISGLGDLGGTWCAQRATDALKGT